MSGWAGVAAALSYAAGGPLLDSTSPRTMFIIIGTSGLASALLAIVLLGRRTQPLTLTLIYLVRFERGRTVPNGMPRSASRPAEGMAARRYGRTENYANGVLTNHATLGVKAPRWQGICGGQVQMSPHPAWIISSGRDDGFNNEPEPLEENVATIDELVHDSAHNLKIAMARQ